VNLCAHRNRIFWQYGTPSFTPCYRYIRCYECQDCLTLLHDDALDGSLSICDHPQHRPKPSERNKP